MNYKVIFTSVTDKDREHYKSSLGSSHMLDETTKIVVSDEEEHEGVLFLKNAEISKLGEEYIRAHATLYYIEFFDDWYVKISYNDYYNDLARNPEKEIIVEFCGIQKGTGREIYRCVETKKYYLREVVYPKEDFAKWYVCGKRKPEVLDDSGDEPRSNLIFVHNNQKEKIRYDDWNGVAAYSDLFNRDFR